MSAEKSKNAKNRGLGRGLDALFEDEEVLYAKSSPAEAAATPAGRRLLGTDQLSPGQFQPRTLFSEDSLEELAQSIRKHGLLQPILVRPLAGEESHFEIIAGERRWRAAQKASLHEVPVIVMELTDEQAIEIALIENLQRENLNPVDEAIGYKKLIERFGHTQEGLAEALGKSRPYIANMMRLLSLPTAVLGYLERGDLSVGHARALVSAKNPEALAREVIEKSLNVRQTESLAANAAGKPVKGKAVRTKDADTLSLEQDLSNGLGMRVSIDSPDGQRGRLNIEFKSLDQLDTLIRKLS